MSRREVSRLPVLTLLLLVAIVKGFPTPHEDDANSNSSGSRPFIEFTKGGIRVNFAGYHAQAGLGGLLTGRASDGGLHASAGTPAGANAAAGLGGTLDGGPAGGLYARAGLGKNSGVNAEAGLGGSLAGPKPEGEIFAKSSVGNLVLPQKTIGKNIQVIQPNKKDDEQVSPSSSASAGASAAASTNDVVVTKKRNQSPASLYFQKRAQERVTQPSPYYDSLKNAQAESTTTASEVEKSTTSHPKSSSTPTVQRNAPGIFTRAVSGFNAATDSGSGASNDIAYKKRSTLFDDIFNIPISALNAVNQLLKNHVGKA